MGSWRCQSRRLADGVRSRCMGLFARPRWTFLETYMTKNRHSTLRILSSTHWGGVSDRIQHTRMAFRPRCPLSYDVPILHDGEALAIWKSLPGFSERQFEVEKTRRGVVKSSRHLPEDVRFGKLVGRIATNRTRRKRCRPASHSFFTSFATSTMLNRSQRVPKQRQSKGVCLCAEQTV